MSTPKQFVCDFCLKPNPRWSYDPTPGTGVEVVKLANINVITDTTASKWAACDDCAVLVDAARADASKLEFLAEHTARKGLHAMGVPSSEHEVRRYAASILKRHSKVVPGFGPRHAFHVS